MKTIETVVSYDQNGNPIEVLLENIPEDTIYSVFIDGKCVCYQKGDKLPKEAKTNIFKIKK